MFLSDENNTAVFPLENGHFPVDEMAHTKHFEVKGLGLVLNTSKLSFKCAYMHMISSHKWGDL